MNFLEGALPGPYERVRHALTNDLQLRRNDAKTAVRFSADQGYVFRGAADLILKHGRFYRGRELPAEHRELRGPTSRCYWNALEAAEADPSLRYCEGCYHTGFDGPKSHAWCVAPDGEMLELTFPADLEELAAYKSELGLPFLPPQYWGYYGVTFDTSYVRAHADAFDDGRGLPLLDRSPAEFAYLRHKFGPDATEARFGEAHDFPTLKVPYDPNRKELPCCSR